MGYGYERSDLKVLRFTNLPVDANEDMMCELCTQFGDVESIQWGMPASEQNFAAQQQKSLRTGQMPTRQLDEHGNIANQMGKSVADIATTNGKADFCLVEFVNAVDAAYAFRILGHSRIRLFGQDIKVSSRAYDFKAPTGEGKNLQNALFGKRSREGHLLKDAIRNYETQYLVTKGSEGGAAEEGGVDSLLAGSAAAISADEMATLGGSSAGIGMFEVGAKLLVENLDKRITQQELTRFFQQFGPFAAPVNLITDIDGFSKGKCVLSYQDFDTSDKVLDEMEGRVFSDRILRIRYAQMEDGSGRLHGSPEERANAKKFHSAAARYNAAISNAKAAITKRTRVEGSTAAAASGTSGGSVPSWAPAHARQQESGAPSANTSSSVYSRI